MKRRNGFFSVLDQWESYFFCQFRTETDRSSMIQCAFTKERWFEKHRKRHDGTNFFFAFVIVLWEPHSHRPNDRIINIICIYKNQKLQRKKQTQNIFCPFILNFGKPNQNQCNKMLKLQIIRPKPYDEKKIQCIHTHTHTHTHTIKHAIHAHTHIHKQTHTYNSNAYAEREYKKWLKPGKTQTVSKWTAATMAAIHPSAAAISTIATSLEDRVATTILWTEEDTKVKNIISFDIFVDIFILVWISFNFRAFRTNLPI